MSNIETIGHLAALWAWALKYAENGELARFDSEEIADAAGIHTIDPADFLRELEAAGWLDRDDRGELTIHAWQEYGGKLAERRGKTLERVQRYRARKQEQELEEEREREDRESKPKARKPKEEGASEITKQAIAQAFSRFWAAYPRKVSKAEAARAWEKLSPSAELEAAIHRGLELQKRSQQWRRDEGAYIPHAATWLNGRRWEDELEPGNGGRPKGVEL